MADRRLEGQLGRGRGHDASARAKDRDIVAEPQDLVDKVTDEEDRDALLLQRLDDLEEPDGLLPRDRRRRLVHDEHTGAKREGLDDLDRLTLGDSEHLDGQADIDVDPEAGQKLARLAPHRHPVDPAEAAGLAADEDVLGH